MRIGNQVDRGYGLPLIRSLRARRGDLGSLATALNRKEKNTNKRIGSRLISFQK